MRLPILAIGLAFAVVAAVPVVAHADDAALDACRALPDAAASVDCDVKEGQAAARSLEAITQKAVNAAFMSVYTPALRVSTADHCGLKKTPGIEKDRRFVMASLAQDAAGGTTIAAEAVRAARDQAAFLPCPAK